MRKLFIYLLLCAATLALPGCGEPRCNPALRPGGDIPLIYSSDNSQVDIPTLYSNENPTAVPDADRFDYHVKLNERFNLQVDSKEKFKADVSIQPDGNVNIKLIPESKGGTEKK